MWGRGDAGSRVISTASKRRANSGPLSAPGTYGAAVCLGAELYLGIPQTQISIPLYEILHTGDKADGENRVQQAVCHF